jgi:hypothetical protein
MFRINSERKTIYIRPFAIIAVNYWWGFLNKDLSAKVSLKEIHFFVLIFTDLIEQK